MIRSAFIEGHHFLVAHRRGYDKAEVDAVMKRLADTLRRYEAQTSEATGATITDLEKARLARAHAEALTADSEAAWQMSTVELSEAKQQAAEIVTSAKEAADQIRQSALADSAGLVRRRNERSEALITSALSEVRALRARALREINDFHSNKRAEAESLIRTAELSSEELIENARHEAGSILGRARREHTELEQRLAQLRTAIAGVEDQFRNLAESTLGQTEIMASMIDLETTELTDAAEEREPEVVRLTGPGMTIDLTGNADETNDESADLAHYAVNPRPTIYERRGGGIKRRLEGEETTDN
ncbi:MAG: ATP synthase F0 subunit B [Acidimicrobiia bacterium]